MTTELKTVPDSWKLVFDAQAIERAISRVSYEILEKNQELDNLAIVGIRTNGEHLAKRLHAKLEEIDSSKVSFGVVDITLYRDDLSHASSHPVLKGTDLPFSIAGSRIVLVDDVLYSGRTVRAALDAVTDFGRPGRVELFTLIDRGHRELPIRSDYVGKNIPTQKEEFVRVRLAEEGFKDGVYLISEAEE